MENTTGNSPPSRTFSEQVADSLTKNGLWPTYRRLVEYLSSNPESGVIFGTTEIVRNQIVRELVSGSKGMAAVPNLTAEFLAEFDRFDLSVQEGFLVSLVDGHLSLEKILKLSPFDHFGTLFNIAALRSKGVLTVPK